MEIERQFIVPRDAVLPPLEGAESTLLAQGYVSFQPEIRLRVINGQSFLLTIKSGAGLSRGEAELFISAAEYEALLPRLQPGSFLIEKRRYHLPLDGGLTAELDVHLGRLSGLCYVEVEFPDEAAARAFTPPAWFGRELTEMREFSSSLLATTPDFATLQKLFPSLL